MQTGSASIETLDMLDDTFERVNISLPRRVLHRLAPMPKTPPRQAPASSPAWPSRTETALHTADSSHPLFAHFSCLSYEVRF
jgi:hypothetical protein